MCVCVCVGVCKCACGYVCVCKCECEERDSESDVQVSHFIIPQRKFSRSKWDGACASSVRKSAYVCVRACG